MIVGVVGAVLDCALERYHVAAAAREAVIVGEGVDMANCQSRVFKPSIIVSNTAIKSERLTAPKAKPIAAYL